MDSADLAVYSTLFGGVVALGIIFASVYMNARTAVANELRTLNETLREENRELRSRLEDCIAGKQLLVPYPMPAHPPFPRPQTMPEKALRGGALVAVGAGILAAIEAVARTLLHR